MSKTIINYNATYPRNKSMLFRVITCKNQCINNDVQWPHNRVNLCPNCITQMELHSVTFNIPLPQYPITLIKNI